MYTSLTLSIVLSVVLVFCFVHIGNGCDGETGQIPSAEDGEQRQRAGLAL